jgi:sugar lactone lactonase YvrE
MDCIWPVAATLGEGPLWDAGAGALWFVDIKAGRIHRCDAGGDDRRTIEVGGNPSFILPLATGGFVVGNRDRLLGFDGERITGEIDRIAMHPTNRFNDATVDAHGRLWFGSMDDEEKSPTGALHLHAGGRAGVAGGECVITNGPAVTGDGRVLYHVDTVGRLIWRFDVADRSTLTNGERFVEIEEDAGNPDGVVLDAEDHLWVALWGGSAVRRYAPDGRLVDEVRFPCPNITKIAFGGADLRTAFATSARAGLDAETLDRHPLAGGVFAFPVAVPGRAMPAARVSA